MPEQCLEAVNDAWDADHLGQALDTVPLDLLRQVESPAEIRMARVCVSQYPLEHVRSASLPTLEILALDAGRDSLARAAVARQLHEVPPGASGRRAAILAAAVSRFVGARPPRVAQAQRYEASVDALGSAAAAAQVRAHATMLRYAGETSDVPTAATEAEALQRALRGAKGRLSPMVWLLFDRLDRTALMVAALLRAGPDAARRLMVENHLAYGMYGRQAPAILADYWLPGRPSSAVPRSGVVSIVAFVSAECRSACEQDFAVLRRMAHRFPAVRTVLVAQTNGYFAQRVPPQPPLEARMDSAWFLGALRLRALLAVTATPFTGIPEPDGRLLANATATDSAYGYLSPFKRGTGGVVADDNVFIVDQRGRVQFEQVLSPAWEPVMTAIVQRLLDGS